MYMTNSDLRHIYFLKAGYIRPSKHKKTIPLSTTVIISERSTFFIRHRRQIERITIIMAIDP